MNEISKSHMQTIIEKFGLKPEEVSQLPFMSEYRRMKDEARKASKAKEEMKKDPMSNNSEKEIRKEAKKAEETMGENPLMKKQEVLDIKINN